MGLIPDETIQEVLGATDIVELVESYFPVRRKGQDFWAVCPFHSESTPSFKVSPARQNYHCFGCGAGGHAIKFVMEYENLEFPAAVKHLAGRAGIVVREETPSPEARTAERIRSQLLDLHKRAADWFHEYLLKSREPDAERARDYLKNRRIDRDTASRWKIGFAPADGKVFARWASESGFSGRLMAASGIMALRDEEHPARGLYTRFRDRVMFPLNNDFGDTVAFSGRILDPEAKTAKYVNSPETALFSKSKIFFGLDKSKRAISKAEAVIICEGQLDMIRCFESGIENVVAPLGTAFTEFHSRMLRRFAGERGEALLCFDSDNAGFKAAGRAYTELTSAGLFVRAVELPDGEDPDSLITSAGAEAFRERVDAARPFYHFQIDRLAKTLDMSDPRDRVRFANEIAPSVAIVSDPVAREAVINEVATRLGISSDDVRKRVASAAREAGRSKRRTGDDEPVVGRQAIAIESGDVRILLRLALTDEDTRRWMEEVRDEAVAHLEQVAGTRLLTDIWKQPPASLEPNDVNVFLANLSPERQVALSSLLMERVAPMEMADAQRALLRIRIKELASARDATITQMRNPNLADSQILDLTSKVETQREELLDLKSALKNIGGSRA